MGTQTFNCTGSAQTFTVPAGVFSLTVEAIGGSGGGPTYGGRARRVTATLPVTPGTTIGVYVGGANSGGTGGWNGGASSSASLGGGGGATDLRIPNGDLATRVIVAGGGGGQGDGPNPFSYGWGGDAGAPGGSGGDGGPCEAGYVPASGGTQSAGGSGGTGPWAGAGGTQGAGGIGAYLGAQVPGGSGAGGYYGGGGGAGTYNGYTSGGGAGGSSAVLSPATLVSSSLGNRSTNGSVTITWQDWPVRTGTVQAAPTLSATATPAMVRTGDIASAPTLSAVAVVDDGTRTGTVTAAPGLSAVAVARLTRTGAITASPSLSAAQVNRISPQRTGTVLATPAASAVALISKQTRTALLTVAPQLSGPGVPDVLIPPGPPLVGKVDLRLMAYAPNGASMGLLPAPDSFQAAVPLNDVPALTGTYATGAPRSDILGQPLEIALEISGDGGATWNEPPDCRFLYLADARDPAKVADAYAFEAKGYVWRLGKTRVLAEGALNGEGRREFSGVTAGALLTTLWAEAQNRGALAGMTLVGGATADAAGHAWTSAGIIRTYDVGQDYLSVLLDLAAAGYVEFRMVGRSLEIYAPDTVMATDRTIGPDQVALRPTQTSEAPFRRTWEGLSDFLQVVGDDGAAVSISNPAALKPWGRWEDFITQGGIPDAGTLAFVGGIYQSLTAAERLELTQGLVLGSGPTPLLDFGLGNYVWTRGLDGSQARYRVRQATLQKEGGTVQGNVVLNDRFLENDIRMRRFLDAIANGASSGSTGGLPTPPGPDILQPAQVGSVMGSSGVYLDSGGKTWANVMLDWPDVTTNLDGTPIIDLDHYQVQQKPDGSTTWQDLTRSTESRASWSPYVPLTVWNFRVRAVDTSDNRGPWSSPITVSMVADTTGPVKPSLPTATSRLGVGSVTWDGKAFNGSAMDADFDHVDVHLSTVSGFTYAAATKVSDLPGAGTAVAPGLTYANTYYGRLVPYDTSGNAGTPSDQFTFSVAPLVDVSNFPDDAMQDLYARTGHFIQLDANQVTANSAAIGFLDTGYIIGAVIQGTEFWTNSSPTSGGIRIRDVDGFKAWANGGGTPTVEIDRTTGLLTARGATITGTVESISGAQRVTLANGVVTVTDTGGTVRGVIYGDAGGMMLRQSVGSNAFVNIGTLAVTLRGSNGVTVEGGDFQVDPYDPSKAAKAPRFMFNGNTIPSTSNRLPNTYIDLSGEIRSLANPPVAGAADSGGTGYRMLRVPNTY